MDPRHRSRSERRFHWWHFPPVRAAQTPWALPPRVPEPPRVVGPRAWLRGAIRARARLKEATRTRERSGWAAQAAQAAVNTRALEVSTRSAWSAAAAAVLARALTRLAEDRAARAVPLLRARLAAAGPAMPAPVKGTRLAIPTAPRRANRRSRIRARAQRLPVLAASSTMRGRRSRATAAPNEGVRWELPCTATSCSRSTSLPARWSAAHSRLP